MVEETERALERLERLDKALRAFMDETEMTHPLRHFLIFLTIAHADLSGEEEVPGLRGISIREAGVRANATAAASARIVQELGDINRQGDPGHRLVMYQSAPRGYGSFKPLRLTPKGRRLALRIAEILEG